MGKTSTKRRKPVSRERRPGEKYSDKAIISALRAARGIVTDAARRLGCNRRTIQTRTLLSRRVAEERSEIDEEMIDHCESKLFAAIDEGDVQAIKLYLGAKARARGYGHRVEVQPSPYAAPGEDARERLAQLLSRYTAAAQQESGAAAAAERRQAEADPVKPPPGRPRLVADDDD